MLIQAVMLDAAVTYAKDKPQVMEKLKAAIAQGAERTFGLDMHCVQLTDRRVRLTSSLQK